MSTTAPIRTGRSVLILLFILGLALLVSASSALAAPLPSTVEPLPQEAAGRTSVTWLGMAGDGRWSNPANWEGHQLPGPADTVRFTAASPDARVDAAFAGVVGGIELESGFAGTVSLDKALAVRGDLAMNGGTLAGEGADLWVEGTARVGGGLLTTPSGTMRAERMDIQAPGIVRMGVNGKLNLAGDGTPLTGDGVLDVTTNRPNSVEYTGQATSDLLSAVALSDIGKGGLEEGASPALNAARRGEPFARNALALSQAGGLVLNRPENNLMSAVVDSVDGYAYFGTFCSSSPCDPGMVVKVRLSDFTRVGSLTLNSDASSLMSAVIDPAAGYAYFGTSNSPGTIIKIRLSDFTRVSALALDPGENSLSSAVIDSAGGYAYFGASGRIVKVRLSDFTRVGGLALNPDEAYPTSAALDAAGGFAYFGATTTAGPGIVIKIRLSDFTRVGSLTLTEGPAYMTSTVLDAANGYAYFGTNTSPGIVVKVQLSDLTRVGTLTLNAGENVLSSAVIDAGSGYAYFGTFSGSGRVVKVQLSDLTRIGALPLNADENSLMSAVIDTTNGYAYFGTLTAPGRVVKIRLSDFTRMSALTLNADESYLTSAVIDEAGGYAYFGTGDMYRALIIKVRLSDFTRIGALVLNSYDGPLATAVIDTAGGNAYFGTGRYSVSNRVIKIRLSDFTRVGALTLASSPGRLTSAVMDAANGSMYFGVSPDWSPGEVVKIRLSDFTHVATVSPFPNVGNLTSAVLDSESGYAYFGAFSQVVKIRLSDFTHVDTLGLSMNAPLTSAVVDQANGYAYFVKGTGVDRIRLSDFGLVDAITLSDTAVVASAVIDPTNGYAYFGTSGSPGQVIKVRLSDFARVGAFTLNAGENNLSSAVIDSENGYAYFGTSTHPGIVVRLDLGNTRTILDSSANASVFGESVTFTATVRAVTSGAPSGSVTFKDDGTVLCSYVSLAAGQATCIASSLALGAHTLTAHYSGDSNFNESVSASVSFTVSKADTTTTVTSDSADASVVGQTTAIHFSVTVNAPGGGTPTGEVTVSDGSLSCIGTVAEGQCSMTWTSPGLRNLTGTYAGDGNYHGSISPAVPHQVNRANTTTTITAHNPNPSSIGQEVTISFTVAAVPPGAGTPTGIVTVSDGTTLCTGTVATGSCAMTFTTSGSKALTAIYSGDVNYSGSAAPSVAHAVNQGGTIVTLSSSANPSVVGQTVTYTATVSGETTATPTGSATFKDGGSVLCLAVLLAGGKATCTHSYAAPGAHTIIATYSGDSTFSANAGTLAGGQTVNKANTTTTLTGHSPQPSQAGQAVVVHYSVAVKAPGSGTPSGNVKVSDGVDACTGAVAAGSCVVTLRTVGTRTLTATYVGDANLNGSTSTGVSHTVNPFNSYLPLITR